MRRPVRRLARRRIRSELDATAVPTWRAPPIPAADASSLHFFFSPGRLPRGRRVYAIGDIHGCLDALRTLHAAIAEDLARRPTTSAMLLHLGDYIDYGPSSAGVIALLADGPPIIGLSTINLMGDHERAALDALSGDGAAATDWLHLGGRASLDSWGVPAGAHRAQWRQWIPEAHIAFLRSLAIDHREGEYLFVHAGIRPGVALARQAVEDKLGIRQTFLASEQDFGFIVVHGHSAGPVPLIRPNRIDLDTGAGNGGKLTCAVLEEDAVAFLSA
jgi:serine/threonine protein phosphatase 1